MVASDAKSGRTDDDGKIVGIDAVVLSLRSTQKISTKKSLQKRWEGDHQTHSAVGG